jgi:hypothetical protein
MKVGEVTARLDLLRAVARNLGEGEPEVRIYVSDGPHFTEYVIRDVDKSGDMIWIEVESA